MGDRDTRRTFLKRSALATAGALAAETASGQDHAAGQKESGEPDTKPPAPDRPEVPVQPELRAEAERRLPAEFREYSRYHPSYGGPVGSGTYLGKMVPGLRGSGLPPVPVETPDVPKLPWKWVNGRKEFHLYPEHVQRELLPGNWMDLWGLNGTMPGPTIEVTQGDKVRFVVHNQLPEMTTIHWHGLELPIEEDGASTLTQDPIPPGGTYLYEFDLHQAGTFFYHSHMPMQEAFGVVGFLIIHPAVAHDPVVDRDFAIVFQNFRIDPNQTIANTLAAEWNWHTINGRSGPYTTPMVVKLGERVRIRIMDFSPMQHHPIHLHGHTFWFTGTEAGRIPPEAWIPMNTILHGVAQVREFEFIAFNPGDWLLHCHMVHHMMNHMVMQSGPRIREGVDVSMYKASLTTRPPVKFPHTDPGHVVPGYPQMRRSKEFTQEEMAKIDGRREVRGMRQNWHEAIKGLMTVVRVLPENLYELVMHSDEPIPPGYVFQKITEGRMKSGKGA